MNKGREILVNVAGIAIDPKSRSPVVILRDQDERVLPIWIGPFEANAIITEKEHLQPVRPLTHDLLKRIILTLGSLVERVVITEIRDNTFFAELHLLSGEEQFSLDCRPSDGIALALRFQAPIYVEEEVLEYEDNKQRASLLDTESLTEFIEGVNPDDFDVH